MDYEITRKVEEAAKNRYEAVIVAAKLARKINLLRLASVEQLGPEAPGLEYSDKVTAEALKELADGKVKYVFKEENLPGEEVI